MTEEKFDTLSIPYFVVKKRSRHGADCGKTDALRENHQARQCFSKALKLKFCSILERFQKHDTYRESQSAVGWTEDTCRRLDEIAKEDKSYIATWTEWQRFENNWKLAFESARLNCTNDREREDFSEAVKAINDLRQKHDQESNHPVLPSHQTRQRTFHSRKTMKMEYLSRVIFVLVGMDRIAILVDLPQVGGLPMNLIFRTRSFGYRKRRFSLQATGHVNSTYTAPRTFHTRKLFSRVAQGSSCIDLFVSKTALLARMLCFALCLSLHLSHLLPCFILRTRQTPVHRNQDSCLDVWPKSLRSQIRAARRTQHRRRHKIVSRIISDKCQLWRQPPTGWRLKMSQWRLGVLRAFCAGAQLPLMPC